MTGNYKAICLKAVDYDENDKMLLLFTAESGKVSARIKGDKKPQNLSFALNLFALANMN